MAEHMPALTVDVMAVTTTAVCFARLRQGAGGVNFFDSRTLSPVAPQIP